MTRCVMKTKYTLKDKKFKMLWYLGGLWWTKRKERKKISIIMGEGNIDEIKILKVLQSILDSISVRIDGNSTKIEEVLCNTNSESELIFLLRRICANIDYEFNSSEESSSVKKDFIETKYLHVKKQLLATMSG